MTAAVEISTCLDRPNVVYQAVKAPYDIAESFVWLKDDMRVRKRGLAKAIVYCRSIRACALLYEYFLNELGECAWVGRRTMKSRLFLLYHHSTGPRNTRHIEEVLRTPGSSAAASNARDDVCGVWAVVWLTTTSGPEDGASRPTMHGSLSKGEQGLGVGAVINSLPQQIRESSGFYLQLQCPSMPMYQLMGSMSKCLHCCLVLGPANTILCWACINKGTMVHPRCVLGLRPNQILEIFPSQSTITTALHGKQFDEVVVLFVSDICVANSLMR